MLAASATPLRMAYFPKESVHEWRDCHISGCNCCASFLGLDNNLQTWSQVTKGVNWPCWGGKERYHAPGDVEGQGGGRGAGTSAPSVPQPQHSWKEKCFHHVVTAPKIDLIMTLFQESATHPMLIHGKKKSASFETAQENSEDLGSWAEMKSWLLMRKIWLLSEREPNHVSPLQNNSCICESLRMK